MYPVLYTLQGPMDGKCASGAAGVTSADSCRISARKPWVLSRSASRLSRLDLLSPPAWTIPIGLPHLRLATAFDCHGEGVQ